MQEQFINEDPELNKAIMDTINYGKGKAVTPWTSIANKYLSQAYEEALNGVKSPRDALVDADKGLRAELKRIHGDEYEQAKGCRCDERRGRFVGGGVPAAARRI